MNTSTFRYAAGVSASQPDAITQAKLNLLNSLNLDLYDDLAKAIEKVNDEIIDIPINEHSLTLRRIITDITEVTNKKCKDDWHARVRLDKNKLAKHTQALLLKYEQYLSSVLERCESKSGLRCFRALIISSLIYPRFKSVRKFIHNDVHMSKHEDPLYIQKKYSLLTKKQIAKLKKLLARPLAKQITINFHPNCSEDLSVIIKASLGDHYSIVQISNRSSDFSIRCKQKSEKLFDEFIYFLTLKIKVSDELGKPILNEELMIRGHSFSSLDDAKNTLNENIHANLQLFLEKSWLIKN